MKFCPHCGTQLDDAALFCAGCGNKLEAPQQDTSQAETVQTETVQAENVQPETVQDNPAVNETAGTYNASVAPGNNANANKPAGKNKLLIPIIAGVCALLVIVLAVVVLKLTVFQSWKAPIKQMMKALNAGESEDAEEFIYLSKDMKEYFDDEEEFFETFVLYGFGVEIDDLEDCVEYKIVDHVKLSDDYVDYYSYKIDEGTAYMVEVAMTIDNEDADFEEGSLIFIVGEKDGTYYIFDCDYVDYDTEDEDEDDSDDSDDTDDTDDADEL